MFHFTSARKASHSNSARLRGIFIALAFFIYIFTAAPYASAQKLTSYTFSATGGTYTPLSGATVQTVSGTVDNGSYPLAPIGFTFRYNGADFTQVAGSTNGLMALGVRPSTSAANNLTTSTTYRFAPLWDDLEVNTAGEIVWSYEAQGQKRVPFYDAVVENGVGQKHEHAGHIVSGQAL